MKPVPRFASFAARFPLGLLSHFHSHSDIELFYVLEGSLEAFQFENGTHGWVSFGRGNVVSISENIKHALRNSSPLPVAMVLVTTSKTLQFLS
jgi:quercetin dioxygenase-like cupin family protein